MLTPPAEEPVTLTEAKLACRVDHADEDAFLTGLIAAGRERCERVAARALVTQTLKLSLDAWPCDSVIRVPRPPLQSVSGVTYVDQSGATQTVDPADYQVDAASEIGRIVPAYTKAWPAARLQVNAIAVTYLAGYGAAALVPGEVKDRIKAYVVYCYENRQDRDEAYLDRLFGGFWCGDF